MYTLYCTVCFCTVMEEVCPSVKVAILKYSISSKSALKFVSIKSTEIISAAECTLSIKSTPSGALMH